MRVATSSTLVRSCGRQPRPLISSMCWVCWHNSNKEVWGEECSPRRVCCALTSCDTKIRTVIANAFNNLSFPWLPSSAHTSMRISLCACDALSQLLYSTSVCKLPTSVIWYWQSSKHSINLYRWVISMLFVHGLNCAFFTVTGKRQLLAGGKWLIHHLRSLRAWKRALVSKAHVSRSIKYHPHKNKMTWFCLEEEE